MLRFRLLHAGYALATTGDVEYVVRTRPLGDGWMAIVNDAVIATGLSYADATSLCDDVEQAGAERDAAWF